uniref:Olfactory receptor 61 n=1 Tax=Meteorus pulchricornis TaxID=51522 RepID=A0A1S5VFP4_9HYME|nr:olfactory receptor 61 [Meteorus pulchricornis]
MVAAKLSEYNTYRKITKWLLLLLGLFPLENASLFYRFLPYIHLFLNLGTAFGMLGFVRAHITNILVVSKRLGLMVSFLTGSLKIVCMIIYHEDAMKLRSLDKHFNILINNPQFTNMAFDGVTAFRRLSWAVSLLVLLSGTVNVITPIILIIYQQSHHFQPVKYILPYLSIYPWNVEPNGYLYKFHFIFETVATYSLVAITSSIEPLFTLYVIQMIGQLREMSYVMEHLNESNDPESSVRDCINQYTNLVECRNMVQKIFGPIILWQIITNAVILCLGIFQLSQASLTIHIVLVPS